MTQTDPARKRGPRGQDGRRRSDTSSLRAASDKGHDPLQAPLFNTGRAKNHVNADGSLVRDPGTSFDAIPSPQSITRGQRIVLSAVTLAGRDGGPFTLEDIQRAVHTHFPQVRISDSGVRSRVAELVRKGSLVVVDEMGITSHARRCRRFRRAD